MLEKVFESLEPQRELEDLLARVNLFCDCLEVRKEFPSVLRFCGAYTVPGEPAPVCGGYVELATFTLAEGDK